MLKQASVIARKELKSYFGSPMALIFVGVFLAATLFTFFWVDTFFARGIADVRPLFTWMPVLMIFLVASLTMRQWSEEQHSGTLEILLTLPVRLVDLVVGKFMAVMALVCIALALTISLPITVSQLGNLDWGPVAGGYLAALLMAAAYAAIGLFVSSRTDNQLVALIGTGMLGGLLFLVGSRGFVDFFGDQMSEILRALGSGSRFESIQRGVVDVRDLLYYLSLAGIFLSLNVLSLDAMRWSDGEGTSSHRRRMTLTTSFVVVNLIALNVWLFPLRVIRLDLTGQREYSLSGATRGLLSNLREPLLIRGYFSDRTHPLLAPLVPRIIDMLREYEAASNGNLEVEIIDPLQDQDKEAEANQTYGIRPTPLQAADRYGASVINAYFDILVRYGDQHVVLNFQDIIEVEPYRSGHVDVRFRNLEYDLTRAVKKVVYGFQSIEMIMGALSEAVNLTLYTTPSTLPSTLVSVPDSIGKVASDLEAESDGKFAFDLVDPDSPRSPLSRQDLYDQYGINPIPVSLFSNDSYYMHMILQIGEESQILFPGGDLSEASIRTAIESGLKRASKGFLKVVGLWTPADAPQQNEFGQQMPSFKQYSVVTEILRENYIVKKVSLVDGEVPVDVDVLFVIAPQEMSEIGLYAIDQYLMRGGSVIIAAGNYSIMLDQFTGALGLQPIVGGLHEMLSGYGIVVKQELMLDPQNEPFPVPVIRDLGGIQVREIQAVNYPFFVDIRPDGMDRASPILANMSALTLHWASPITWDEASNSDREVTVLLRSSNESWTTQNANVQPDLVLYPEYGFPVGSEQESHILAVSVQGQFESYFADQASPLQSDNEDPGEEISQDPATIGTLESSPANTQLVVIGSAEFLNDLVFDMSASLSGDRYLNSLQFAENMVGWSVEDVDLLSIRSRGISSRPLYPLTERGQVIWETANYVFVLLALASLGWIWRVSRRNEKPIQLVQTSSE